MASVGRRGGSSRRWTPHELAAVELARRVAASDVGGETLALLEAAVDDLASYAGVGGGRGVEDRAAARGERQQQGAGDQLGGG